jgi:acyl carrier protein
MIDKILNTIATYAKLDPSLIDENSNMLDYDIDSLCVLNIIMEIERTFGVRFEDEEIVEIRTAKDIEKAILTKYQ